MWKRNMSSEEAAQVIKRFLARESDYPQEWNDFVETRQQGHIVELYRKRCYELDPLVNRPNPPEQPAVEELHSIIQRLRNE
jgi:hypothetical protein